MARYRVEVSRTAEKQIAGLPRADQVRVLRAIVRLQDDPRPSGCRKLEGYAATYRVRVGLYRIIYDVDDPRILAIVLKVGHRRDVYR
jgi:mRNA interferase RelE/StbE